MKRAIILLPQFPNIHTIQSIRERFDPLATRIAPHITLVFPFDSDIPTDALKSHINEAIKGIRKFSIGLKGITGDVREGYLFLDVKKGNDDIIELHDRLYSGMLEEYLCRRVPFRPHLTVGRVQEQAVLDRAVDEWATFDESFETVVDTIYVENIDDMENSVIEHAFYLLQD